ncbi:MAG: hypothetical protein ACLP1X_34330 [Polyangiaceae bacterium]|jgi:hypothetical protein
MPTSSSFKTFTNPIHVMGHVLIHDVQRDRRHQGLPLHGTRHCGATRERVLIRPGLDVPWAWTLSVDEPEGVTLTLLEFAESTRRVD